MHKFKLRQNASKAFENADQAFVKQACEQRDAGRRTFGTACSAHSMRADHLRAHGAAPSLPGPASISKSAAKRAPNRISNK